MTEHNADLLYGARAIAAFLGMTESAVYGLVKKKVLPVFKIGSKVCARKSGLTAWLDAKTQVAA
ncbi:helix-turn-helix domain-containing protein [Rhizobium sp. IMFF44]|uniref:helix-turn-helix domain-containing protein n=1 Tax=Rhizobium sp. IMFF44 TaxID=3342350 RepID=UPI0035B950E4